VTESCEHGNEPLNKGKKYHDQLLIFVLLKNCTKLVFHNKYISVLDKEGQNKDHYYEILFLHSSAVNVIIFLKCW
jgi:hypothetical protein